MGRTEPWKLRRALVVRPEGYSTASFQDWSATVKRLADDAPASGIDPKTDRRFSEPLDMDSAEPLTKATIELLEASARTDAGAPTDDAH